MRHDRMGLQMRYAGRMRVVAEAGQGQFLRNRTAADLVMLLQQ